VAPAGDNLVCPPRPMIEPVADGGLLVRAPAKLNLALAVGARRGDGLHEIDSIAAKVTLYDELTFHPRPGRPASLECTGLPCGPPEANLVLRAAALLAGGVGAAGVDVRLAKRIPAGAGLGGGSSDAAAALVALDRLRGAGLGPEALADLAAALGSDVPLFLNGPSARVRGRGERVEPVEVHDFHALLCLPEAACPTASVYAAHDAIAGGTPSGRAVAPAAFARPPGRWGGAVFNDLTAAAERVCPPVADVRRRLAEATGRAAHVTGSSSGVFVPAADAAEARRLAEALPADLRTRCRIVARNPW